MTLEPLLRRAARARGAARLMLLLVTGPWLSAWIDNSSFARPIVQRPSTLEADDSSPVLITGEHGSKAWTGGRDLELRNPGAGTIKWSAATSAPWLAVAPASGSLGGGQDIGVALRVAPDSASKLAAGVYEGSVSLGVSGVAPSVAVSVLLLVTEGGWTKLSPAPDARRVYVSSSRGSDKNDGLSESTPKASIAAASALMRDGFPDWLLLRRGDVWDTGLGHWIRSGRSVTQPMVIASYGTELARPLLRTGSGNGLVGLQAGSSGSRVDFLAVLGLHFEPHTYTGVGSPCGVTWMIESTGLLVEDCMFDGYEVNFCVPGFGGRKRSIVLRRNVIVDAFATQGTVGHGIYLANCDGVLIEENVLDRNGWNPAIEGADASVFRHGIYVQSSGGRCSGVSVRRNIIANSASHGLQLRSGGVVEDNLFLRNSIALQLGGGNEPQDGGVRASALRNVILGGKDIDAANPRGWGILLQNLSAGALVENVVARREEGGMPVAISIDGLNGIGVHSTSFRGNIIHGWGGPFLLTGNSRQLSAIELRDNVLHNALTSTPLVSHSDPSNLGALRSSDNRFHNGVAALDAWFRIGSSQKSLADWRTAVGDVGSTAAAEPFPGPGRDIVSYQDSIGAPGTLQDFLTRARAQSKLNWSPPYTAAAVNAHVRAGFGLD